MNRQQFNKYLSGSSMPSATTLRRICAHLQVNEAMLIGNGNDLEVEQSTHFNSNKALVRDYIKFSRLLGIKDPKTTKLKDLEFEPGMYNCYFPFDDYPGFAIRSLIKIYREQNQLFFRRLTRIKSVGSHLGTIARGRHFGAVIVSGEDITLLGRNSCPPFQISFITLERKKLFKSILLGFSITRSSEGQIATRIVLEKLSDLTTPRNAILSLGLIAVDHLSVSPQIQAVLSAQSPFKNNSLKHPSIDQLVFDLQDVNR